MIEGNNLKMRKKKERNNLKVKVCIMDCNYVEIIILGFWDISVV